jgi:hypothetical protein
MSTSGFTVLLPSREKFHFQCSFPFYQWEMIIKDEMIELEGQGS